MCVCDLLWATNVGGMFVCDSDNIVFHTCVFVCVCVCVCVCLCVYRLPVMIVFIIDWAVVLA